MAGDLKEEDFAKLREMFGAVEDPQESVSTDKNPEVAAEIRRQMSSSLKTILGETGAPGVDERGSGARAPKEPRRVVDKILLDRPSISDDKKFKYKRSQEELITQLKKHFPQAVTSKNEVNPLILMPCMWQLSKNQKDVETEEKMDLIIESLCTMDLFKDDPEGNKNRIIGGFVNALTENINAQYYKLFRPIFKYYLNSDYVKSSLEIEKIREFAIKVIVDKACDPRDIELLIEFCKKEEVSTEKLFTDSISHEDGSGNLLGLCISNFAQKEVNSLDNLLEMSRLIIENSGDNFKKTDLETDALTFALSLFDNERKNKPETGESLIKLMAILIINSANIKDVDIDNIDSIIPDADLAKGLAKLIKNTIDEHTIETALEFYGRIKVDVNESGQIDLIPTKTKVDWDNEQIRKARQVPTVRPGKEKQTRSLTSKEERARLEEYLTTLGAGGHPFLIQKAQEKIDALDEKEKDLKIIELTGELKKNSMNVSRVLASLIDEKVKELKRQVEENNRRTQEAKDREDQEKARLADLSVLELVKSVQVGVNFAPEVLRSQIAALKNNLQELTQENSDLTSLIEQLTSTNKELGAISSDLRSKITTLEEDKERESKKHTKTLVGLKKTHKDNLDNVKQNNQGLKKEKKALEAELQKLQTAESRLESEAAALQKQLDKFIKSKDNGSKAEDITKIGSLESDNERLQNVITGLEKEVTQLTESSKKEYDAKLASQASEQDAQIAEIIAAKDVEIRRAQQAISKKVKKFKKHREKVNEAGQEKIISELKEQVDAMAKDQQEKIDAAIAKERSKMGQEISAVVAESRVEIDQSHASEMDELEKKFQDRSATENMKFAHAISEHNRQTALWRNSNRQLVQELQATRGNLLQTHDALRINKGNLEHTSQELAKVQDALEFRKVITVNGENMELNNRMVAAQREVADLKADLAAAHRVRDAATTGLPQLHAQIDALQAENMALRGMINGGGRQAQRAVRVAPYNVAGHANGGYFAQHPAYVNRGGEGVNRQRAPSPVPRKVSGEVIKGGDKAVDGSLTRP